MKELALKVMAATVNHGNINDITGEGEGTIQDIVGQIINAVIGILGIACVVIIIIGGIGYMTSSGDAGKVKKARDTILYGVIGIIICVLAYAIAQFVINAINNAATTGGFLIN